MGTPRSVRGGGGPTREMSSDGAPQLGNGGGCWGNYCQQCTCKCGATTEWFKIYACNKCTKQFCLDVKYRSGDPVCNVNSTPDVQTQCDSLEGLCSDFFNAIVNPQKC